MGVGQMMRFIDLRGQAVGARFAFYDTVTDSFVGERSCQTWSTEQELRSDIGDDPALADRLAQLLPDWARVPPTLEEEESLDY